MRLDNLNVGNVIDWRGFPATVKSVEIGRQVDVVIGWDDSETRRCRIRYPLLTAAEWNAYWTDEDFAARLEADLQAVQFDLIAG